MKIISKRLSSFFASIPSVGAALLPACPICTTALAGFFSSIGLSAVNYSPYLLPLTIGFLIIALLSLFFTGRGRHNYLSLILGLFAAILIIFGKFGLKNNFVNYSGIALLIIASLWNLVPKLSLMKGGVNNG